MDTKPIETPVAPSTIRPIIAAYEARWGHKWPFTEADAGEHYREARTQNAWRQGDKWDASRLREHVLDRMREDHHFPDHAAPFGTKGTAAAAEPTIRPN